MKNSICITFIFAFLLVTFSVCEAKEADLAGTWYPASAERLEAMLDGYLKDAKPDKIPPDIISLILPHAGYIYSGFTAE